METKSFRKWFNENSDPNDMCPPALSDEDMLNFLQEYLLPKGWYTAALGGPEQINTEIVHRILLDHSKRYQLEWGIEQDEYWLSEERNPVCRFLYKLDLKLIKRKLKKLEV